MFQIQASASGNVLQAIEDGAFSIGGTIAVSPLGITTRLDAFDFGCDFTWDQFPEVITLYRDLGQPLPWL